MKFASVHITGTNKKKSLIYNDCSFRFNSLLVQFTSKLCGLILIRAKVFSQGSSTFQSNESSIACGLRSEMLCVYRTEFVLVDLEQYFMAGGEFSIEARGALSFFIEAAPI